MDKLNFLIRVQEIADGVDQIEPLLEDLVDHIRANGSCRPRVLERFLDLIQQLDPWNLEVLQFCMYDLRWQEVSDQAHFWCRQEGGVGRRRLYERLIESFDDSWPEREFFRRYSD